MSEPVEVSVVMPCLNEERGVEICINKIKEVFAKEGSSYEIIVADNGSTDGSIEVARRAGARVVTEERKGYGAAYLKGLREARGRYIVIGDSDNTYDFYDIPKFLEPLRKGYDFVMGSRFKGTMRKGAMSWSHRYIGNPILSFMTRLFFKTALSDIHCGMRAFTNDAYKKMRLKSLGMEFATEMVLASLTYNIKVFEVPIDYHPREGESKLSPIWDAWRHVRFMLIYCPLWLYFIPGAMGFSVGFALMVLLLPGPVIFLGRVWDMHVLIFGAMTAILSFTIMTLGVFAHTFAITQGFLKYDPVTLFFQKIFNLEKGLFLGGVIFFSGLVVIAMIFAEWFFSSFGPLYRIRESILAMTLMVIGVQTMFSCFFVSLLFMERE